MMTMRLIVCSFLQWTASLILLANPCRCLSSSPPVSSKSNRSKNPLARNEFSRESRRSFLLATSTLITSLVPKNEQAALAISESKEQQGRFITIRLESPDDRVGVELYDVTIGSPPVSVVAVKNVPTFSAMSSSRLLQAGVVLRSINGGDGGSVGKAADVYQRIRQGPYPIELRFENLAAGGDAISDLGTPIVTSQDALDLARRTSSIPSVDESQGLENASSSSKTSGYSTTLLERARSLCTIQSRRGDVLEIEYEAHLNGPEGRIYDSSETRGTGQPYQMVLGSGDMLPGVDLGLYDMCPGDVRALKIPPRLAYGARGNKLFQIPPDTNLYWKVQLVSVQSVRAGDTRTREDLEGRYEYN